MKTHNIILNKAVLCLFVASLFTTTGCTVFRDRDPKTEEDGGGKVVIEPKEIDLLVLVDLDRGAANLSGHYQNVLATLNGELAKKKINIRSAAMAPLYQRTGQSVPLLFGQGHDSSEFSNFGDAITYYTLDDSQNHLPDKTKADGQNLADLGHTLGNQPIYHAESADPTGKAYFSEAADGMLIVYLSASARPCALNDAGCMIDGQTPPVEYFSEVDPIDPDEPIAAWLKLANNTGLHPKRIFHLAIVTPEKVSYTDFANRCNSYPNFPATTLDVMEPSPNAYYEPFIKELQKAGGNGNILDLCQVLSSNDRTTLATIANQIQKIF